MKKIYFEDIESLTYNIVDEFDSFKDEFSDVSIIAKYDKAKEIIKKLICIGYDIASLEIFKEEYFDEYIISLSKVEGINEIYCEKFKRESGYFYDESTVTYVLEDCNSKCLAKIKSPYQYEVAISEDIESFECAECTGGKGCKEYLALDEAYAKLDEMETKMTHISDMVREMNNFNQLFN